MTELPGPPSDTRHRLEVTGDDGASSHLGLRLAMPATAAQAAPAVLYLHGFRSSQDGDKATFFRQHLLAAGLCVASIDFQGHGESGGTLFDLSLSRNLDDIDRALAFLRERGYSRFVLFGSSMGAAAAMWYAGLHAGAGIEAAVHIAPALDLHARLGERVGEHGLRRWQRDGRIALPHERGPVEVSSRLIDDLAGYPVDRLARRYTVPTLVFQGRYDTSVSWRAQLDFAADCDHDAVDVVLLGAGDHRLTDHRDLLWRLARTFLAARGLIAGEA